MAQVSQRQGTLHHHAPLLRQATQSGSRTPANAREHTTAKPIQINANRAFPDRTQLLHPVCTPSHYERIEGNY
jgi:hypothetical protein